MIQRMAKRAKIEKRVHPHGLRHTHAYELANEGTPLHVIQQQLGHSSLATTDRYISHLSPQAVIKAMKARGRSPISIAIVNWGFLEENLLGSPKTEACAGAVVE